MAGKVSASIKLNGMELHSDIISELFRIDPSIFSMGAMTSGKEVDMRYNGEFVIRFGDSTHNYEWPIFDAHSGDRKFLNFLREKFPEYLI